jgi:hypothetical protein
MENLPELIRTTTSLFAIATAITIVTALKGTGRAPVLRLVAPWLTIATAGGLVLSHITRALPSPAMVPAVAAIGLGLGIATQFSSEMSARFAALDDRQWRVWMLIRAVFGSLIIAAGASGMFPLAFAIPAGLGDILVGGLALIVPGSLAAGGHRGSRLLVYGVGVVDFANVIALQILVLVPWLAQTHSLGISLLLPWVAVPLLATINLAGLRLVLKELIRPRVTAA